MPTAIGGSSGGGDGASQLRTALLGSASLDSAAGLPSSGRPAPPRVINACHGGGGLGVVTQKARPPLSLLSLFFLTYFQMTVLYGLEDAAASLSPLVSVLVFAVAVPLLWVVPMCLITGELGTAFKDEGHAGATHWVRVAFGPFWGGMDGYLNVVASVADCAVQPALMFSYVTYSLDIDEVAHFAILFISIGLSSFLVYRGLAELGRTEELVFLASATPFYILIAVSMFRLDLKLLVHTPKDTSLSIFFQVVFWSATYLQRQSVLAGEVQDCARNFPRALLAAGLAASAINAIGFFAICAADTWLPFEDWSTGTFKAMADGIVGSWLGSWIVVGSVCSCVGAMVAGINATVFTILGQAERGWLPRPLARRGRHGTPAFAIGVVALVMAALQFMDYIDLVALDNFMYCAFSLLELAAFVRLRFVAPDLPRPFRVPLPGRLGALIVLPPAVVIAAVLFFAGSVPWVVGGSTTMVGFVVVGCFWWIRQKEADGPGSGGGPDKLPPFRRPSWARLIGSPTTPDHDGTANSRGGSDTAANGGGGSGRASPEHSNPTGRANSREERGISPPPMAVGQAIGPPKEGRPPRMPRREPGAGADE